MAKIFKGFKQVSAKAYQDAKDAQTLDGYLWFVRTEVLAGEETEGANDVANDSYDIYFGSRHYGHFCEGELDNIKSAITALEGDVAGILTTLESLTSVLETHANAITANTNAIAVNKAAHEANAAAITGLTETLKNYLVKDVSDDDQILSVAEGVLSAQIGIEYKDGNINLTGKNGDVITGFSAADFVKDAFLDDVKVEDKEDGKYIVFTWNTDSGQKTDEIKVSDFATIYDAGTALELVAGTTGDTFNVKIAANDNFLSVNENNELIVDDMTVDKTKIKEDIRIEGGPLATDSVKAAFKDGVITGGTDIQTVLKALLCVNIYPKPTANTPNYTISINAPTVKANFSNNALVEVGASVTISAVTANEVYIKTQTDPKVATFNHGYADSVDGEDVYADITELTTTWNIGKADDEVYSLSASIVSGFTDGVLPSDAESSASTECVLSACTLTAVAGANTYKVTQTPPKYVGSHDAIPSKYVISNLGERSESEKSPLIASASTVERNASVTSTTFTVTGVYPVFTNGVTASTKDETAAAMADLAAHVSGDGTKLALMKANTEFAVSFAAHTEGVEGYRLYLPGDWKVKSAMAINANTAKFAVDQKSKFVALKDAEGKTLKVTRTIQNKEVDYTVYEYLATEGANRVKFTVG